MSFSLLQVLLTLDSYWALRPKAKNSSRSPLRHASSLPSSTLSNAQASPQQYDKTCNACRFYGIYMCLFKLTVDLKLGHGGSHSGYWDIVCIVSRKISAKFTGPKSLLWSISNFPSSLQASTSENLNRRVSRSFSGRSSISEHVCNAGLASLSTEPKLKPATGLRTVPGSDGRISETVISKIVSKIDQVPVCNKS
nr:hypothetical protein Iba_chr09dCG13440 [Ipomoea batatas]